MTLRTGFAVLVTVGLIAVLSIPAGAQGTNGNSYLNWNFLGGGARGRGMGGAYLGISDDAHAATWNPAGLVYNEGVLLSLNYSYSNVGLDLDYGTQGGGLTPHDENAGLSHISSAAFISPLTVLAREFTVSLFYNRLQDTYTRSFFNAEVDPVVGVPFTANYGMSGNLAATGGAFATTIRKRLSLGVGISILTGDGLEFLETAIDSSGDSTAYNQQTTWTSTSDLDYSGLSATISALYRAEKWSAGIVVSPSYGLTQSVDYFARRLTIHNQNPAYSAPVYGPLHGTKREITMPFTVGLGGSYKLSDNILLAADYSYRAFNADGKYETDGSSNYRFQESPSEPNSEFEEVRVAWYNLHQVRIGGEYRRETSWGVVPIRAGIRNEPMLMGDVSANDVYFDQRLDSGKTVEFPYYSMINKPAGSTDQVNGWTFSVGSGIHWSQVRLDAALEFTSFSFDESGNLYSVQRCPSCLVSDPTVTVDEWDKRKTTNWGNYSKTYDNTKVRFLFNFTGYF